MDGGPLTHRKRMPGAVGTRAWPGASCELAWLSNLCPKWGSSVLFGERPRQRLAASPPGSQGPVNRPLCPSIALSDPVPLSALCCRSPSLGTKTKELPGARTVLTRPGLGSSADGPHMSSRTGRLGLCASLREVRGFNDAKWQNQDRLTPLPAPCLLQFKAWLLCQAQHSRPCGTPGEGRTGKDLSRQPPELGCGPLLQPPTFFPDGGPGDLPVRVAQLSPPRMGGGGSIPHRLPLPRALCLLYPRT